MTEVHHGADIPEVTIERFRELPCLSRVMALEDALRTVTEESYLRWQEIERLYNELRRYRDEFGSLPPKAQ